MASKKPMAVKNEALKGGQKKLDVDKDGKLDFVNFYVNQKDDLKHIIL